MLGLLVFSLKHALSVILESNRVCTICTPNKKIFELRKIMLLSISYLFSFFVSIPLCVKWVNGCYSPCYVFISLLCFPAMFLEFACYVFIVSRHQSGFPLSFNNSERRYVDLYFNYSSGCETQL